MMQIDARQLDAQAAHTLLKGCVTPRAIAWVSTMGKNGVPNAAPFSCFTFVAFDPPLLAFSIERRGEKKKDTLVNIEQTRELVVNVTPEHLARQMNATAEDHPPDVSEFDVVGITPLPGQAVKAPRIAESPVSMECQAVNILELGRSRHSLVIAEVLLFHVRDDLYQNGEINAALLRPLARLTGNQYGCVREVFDLPRPWLAKS